MENCSSRSGRSKRKFFWDFAYNFEGGQRDNEILGVQENGFLDKQSWIAGVQIGEPKRKGDWYVSAEFHQVGLGSTDPNLNDTNFGLSRLNTQGIPPSRRLQHRARGCASRCGTTARGTWRKTSTTSTANG